MYDKAFLQKLLTIEKKENKRQDISKIRTCSSHGFELVTRIFELVTCRYKLVTCRFEIVTRGIEFSTRKSVLVTHIPELIYSCFTFARLKYASATGL